MSGINKPGSTPCDRTDLPEWSDMRCGGCSFNASEHPAWRRQHCRSKRYADHGAAGPCVLCGYQVPRKQ